MNTPEEHSAHNNLRSVMEDVVNGRDNLFGSDYFLSDGRSFFDNQGRKVNPIIGGSVDTQTPEGARISLQIADERLSLLGGLVSVSGLEMTEELMEAHIPIGHLMISLLVKDNVDENLTSEFEANGVIYQDEIDLIEVSAKTTITNPDELNRSFYEMRDFVDQVGMSEMLGLHDPSTTSLRLVEHRGPMDVKENQFTGYNELFVTGSIHPLPAEVSNKLAAYLLTAPY